MVTNLMPNMYVYVYIIKKHIYYIAKSIVSPPFNEQVWLL